MRIRRTLTLVAAAATLVLALASSGSVGAQTDITDTSVAETTSTESPPSSTTPPQCISDGSMHGSIPEGAESCVGPGGASVPEPTEPPAPADAIAAQPNFTG